jgi:ankyrin repeat protein
VPPFRRLHSDPNHDGQSMKLPLALLCILVATFGCGSSKNHQLFQAIEKGDLQSVKRLANGGADLDAPNLQGLTPLLVALEIDQLEIFETLLEKGASPNKIVLNGVSVMNEAAGRQDDIWLRKALAHRGDPNLVNDGNHHAPGSTPIFYAIDYGAVECAKALIDARAEVNWATENGDIPLIEAAQSGEFDIVLLLLEAGADFRKKTPNGNTFIAEMKDRTPEMCGNDQKQRSAFLKVQAWLRDKGVKEAP